MSFRYDAATGRAKVTIYAGKDQFGRQRQRSYTWRAPNERQARREAPKHEARLRDELAAKLERRKTVAGLVDEWQALRDREDSPSTVRKRRAMVARIRDDLGRIPLHELTAQHVDQWMADLSARGLSPTTVANHWSCLRAILRQGDRWDLVSPRAALKARPPRRKSNRRPTPPTTSAVSVLIGKARPDLAIAASLAAFAGLRAGEVMGLRWPRVDLDAGVLHIAEAVVAVEGGGHHRKAPKSGEERYVVIDDDLVEALRLHRADLERRAEAHGARLAPDAAVLPDFRRDPTGRVERRLDWLAHAWAKHAARHGAEGVRFHDLRHWYATELIDAGVPMPVVQQQLGHLQLSTTVNVYTHAVEGGGRRAADVLRERRRAALPPGIAS